MSKLALVTGANRGIGLAIAKGLADEGLKVLMAVRDVSAGKKSAKEVEGAEVVQLDLSDREQLKKQIDEIIEKYPDIDVVVNNAGILKEGDINNVSDEDFNLSMNVNFFGPYEMIRAFAPLMEKKGYGRIVNVSSGWGSFYDDGLTGPAAYSISKAALNALTLNSSRAYANVKINSMCPGWVKTDMGGPSATRSPEEGADTAIFLATLPDSGPTGKFFRDRKEIDW